MALACGDIGKATKASRAFRGLALALSLSKGMFRCLTCSSHQQVAPQFATTFMMSTMSMSPSFLHPQEEIQSASLRARRSAVFSSTDGKRISGGTPSPAYPFIRYPSVVFLCNQNASLGARKGAALADVAYCVARLQSRQAAKSTIITLAQCGPLVKTRGCRLNQGAPKPLVIGVSGLLSLPRDQTL